MDNQRLDLGTITSVRAETFGEPGARTFRLLAESPEGKVSLWLEKEQMVVLGSALDELLERVPENQGQLPQSTSEKTFVGDLEVKVGSLAVGYDASRQGFTVEATDFETPFAISAISLLARRDQFADVRREIAEIVSGGRPRCPLCGRPITDGSHFCPNSNGHARISGIE